MNLMSMFNLDDYKSLQKYLGDNYLVDGLQKRDLFKICDELGVTVYTGKFKDDSLSGMIKKNNGGWDIYVNESDSPRRKTFTVAHELGHVFSFKDSKHSKNLLDKHGVHEDKAIFARPTDNGKKFGNEIVTMEAEANFIAANLLMPEQLVRAFVAQKKNIEEMAEEFGVSESAMGFRLLNLGLAPMESVGTGDGSAG